LKDNGVDKNKSGAIRPRFWAYLSSLMLAGGMLASNLRLRRAHSEAQQTAQRAIERGLRLQQLTAALSEALTQAQVAEVTIEQAMATLGATTGIVYLLDDLGTTLEMVSARGYSADIMEKWQRFPMTNAVPLTDAVRTGLPVWVESIEARDERYPTPTTDRKHDAWAAMPMIVEGRTIGGIRFSFPKARIFHDDDRAFLLILAGQCAQALERARLYEAEQDAREHAEQMQDRLAFLAEASVMLGSSLDDRETLDQLAQLVVPFLADLCVIHLIADNGTVTQPAIVSMNPQKQNPLRKFYETHPLLVGHVDTPFGKTLRNIRAELTTEITDEYLASFALTPEHLQIVRDLGITSRITAPLVARGNKLGIIALSTLAEESDRIFDLDDLVLVEEMARRAAIAIDNSRLYQQAQLARTLAEASADRTLHLQSVTAALSETYTIEEVAEVVLRHAREAVAPEAGGLMLLGNDNNTVRVVHSFGLSEPLVKKWETFQAQAWFPVGDAIRNGKFIWFETGEERLVQYPQTAHYPELRTGAWAILPLIVEGRAVIGAITLAYLQDRTFSEADRAFMRALAQQGAQAIERARLYVELYAYADNLKQKVNERTAELQEAVTRAQSADQAKSALLSTVSHEMRTPLSSIIGFSNLILSRNPPREKLNSYVSAINVEARRLAGLVNDFLDLQRIESGREVFHFSETDLVPLVNNVIATQELEEDVRHKIRSDVIPSALIYGDPNRIQQVIYNLLTNAIKYSPGGGEIVLSMSQTESEVIISIRDKGVGIPTEELAQLFERFYRGNVAQQQRIRGTGLGLALCREIVRGHGGRIWAESEGANQGATFSFALPLPKQPVAEEPRLEVIAATGSHLLLIEDDMNFAIYLAERLNREGYRVQTVRFEAATFDFIAEQSPALIVLDILQGYEEPGWPLLAELKQHPATQNIPVLVCSALNDPERVREMGAASFVRKPVDEGFLLREIARLLDASMHTVLVVDDSEPIRLLLDDTLASAGYRICMAENGQEAIQQLTQDWPDLIILDLFMPEVNGFDVLEWIRVVQGNLEIPIIVFTAAELPAAQTEAVQKHASALAIKSETSPKQILELVRRLLPVKSQVVDS
jgi:signal transduction histidine kinase/DNA-binding response OmpR family regulator